MRFGDQGEDSPQGGANGNAENVGIGERVAEQGLKTGSGDGERRANNNGEENARQANIDHDHAVVAGDLSGLAKKSGNEVAAQAIKRNGDGAELERDNDHGKQD